MPIRRAPLCSCLLALAVTATAWAQPPAAPAPPAIRFEAAAVVAEGLPAQGRVAWLGVAREATGEGSRIVRREALVADDDGDRAVRLALGQPVPPRSMWAAVDLATGELALAAPEGYPLRRVAFPPGTVTPGPGGKLDRLTTAERDMVELFVVRPGVGAWVATLWDGAEGDEDGPANRRISAALADLEPVEGSPAPPDSLAPGDVVVVMDPDAMQVSAARLPGGGQ